MPRRDCDPVTAPRHSPALHCATPRCNVSCWALPASCSSTAHAPRGGVRLQNTAVHASPLRGYCQGTPTVPRTGEYSRRYRSGHWGARLLRHG